MLVRWLLLFIVVLLALRAVGRFIGGISQGVRSDTAGKGTQDPPVKMAQDPVCGTFVVPGKALSASTGGATVWFCSQRCRDEFARRG
jgi:YHS domain-containing protein